MFAKFGWKTRMFCHKKWGKWLPNSSQTDYSKLLQYLGKSLTNLKSLATFAHVKHKETKFIIRMTIGIIQRNNGKLTISATIEIGQ